MRIRAVATAVALTVVLVGGYTAAQAAVRANVRSNCWGWTPYKNYDQPFFERALDLCVEGKMKHRGFLGLNTTPKGMAAAACGQEWAAVTGPLRDDLRASSASRLAQYGVTDLTDDSPEARKRFFDACMPEQTARYEARQRSGGD